MVSAIVLAGGYATRLRPLSLTKPKSLFPLLDKPILEYTLEALKEAGVNNIYLSLRVMADKLISYVESTGVNSYVKPIIEKEPLGDGGPLKYIHQNFDLDDDVVVIYGDIFSEMNFKDLINFHMKNGCSATIVGTRVNDPRRYGVLYQENEKLIELIEKPKNPISNLINAGMYVFKKELFKEIDRFPYSISKDFMPKILRRCCVSVYQYNGVWADIGLPSDYLKLNFQLLVKKHPKGYVSPTAKVSERSVLNPPYFIGDQVSIGSDTYVNPNTVIGKRSKIGEGVYLQEALLMEGVKVGDHSYISNVIIADNSRIGKWNRIMEGSILGEEVITKDGVMLNQKTIILPYKEVSDSVTEKGKIIL
jgi:mannose-1-phosphate guanylyltransferase